MGRLIPSLIASLNIKNIFCKDLLKSIRFHLILISQKEQKSHYKHITIKYSEPFNFFTHQGFFYIQSMLLLTLCQNNENQIECEITKDLYQIQINISINLESERIEET